MADLSHGELILSAITEMSKSLIHQSDKIGELTAEIKLQRVTHREAPKTNGGFGSAIGLFSMAMTLTLTMIIAVVTIFNGQISAVNKSIDIARVDLSHATREINIDINRERSERNSALIAIAKAHTDSVVLITASLSREREDRITQDASNELAFKERYDDAGLAAHRNMEFLSSLVDTNKQEQIAQLQRLEEANDEIVKAVFRRLGGGDHVESTTTKRRSE